MLRSILVASFAAHIAVSSANPVLAPDALDARLGKLEAKLKALDIDDKKEANAKSIVKKESRRGGHSLGCPFTLSSGGGSRGGDGKVRKEDCFTLSSGGSGRGIGKLEAKLKALDIVDDDEKEANAKSLTCGCMKGKCYECISGARVPGIYPDACKSVLSQGAEECPKGYPA